MRKPIPDTRNYGKFHPRFAAGGEVGDSDEDEPFQMAAEPIPPKGSIEAVRPGKVPGEAGGGGAGGGRLDFKSAGAKRGEGDIKPRAPAKVLSPEEDAARRADMKAAYDKMMEKFESPKAKEKPALDPSAGRIGFSSLGTKKADDE